jgi:drug/metabolite transporter (DMT)-like permease
MSLLSASQAPARVIPQGWEWLWLGVLSLVCTVWAFSVYLGLLRRLSVFSISLVSNLEPVWGVLMAGLVYDEFSKLNPPFWVGGLIVMAAVAIHPLWQRRNSCPAPILS